MKQIFNASMPQCLNENINFFGGNDLATSATSVLSDMPHSPNKASSKMEDVICKIIDLQEEINHDKRSLKAAFYVAIQDDYIRKNPFDFQLSEEL